MTFKHVKFEDSPIMRSLEKVAKEKGLIKPEPLQKTASAPKLDVLPTKNLMENIFKLCAGLRFEGFHKYADELEVNYLNYKKAQTLYETSKEKGEDVVHAAHPKGSHKLEDVDSGEAVVEDILDRQLKMLEVVNKKPSGKLSTASALRAVKTVLGQDPNIAITNTLASNVESYVTEIISNANNIVQQAEPHLTFSVMGYAREIARQLGSEATLDSIKKAQEVYNYLYVKIAHGPTVHQSGGIMSDIYYNFIPFTGLDEDTWSKIKPLFDSGFTMFSKLLSDKAKLNEMIGKGYKPSSNEPSMTSDQPLPRTIVPQTYMPGNLGEKIDFQLNRISAWKSYMTSFDQNAQAQINQIIPIYTNALQKIKQQYSSPHTPDQYQSMQAAYEDLANKIYGANEQIEKAYRNKGQA